MTGAQVDNMLPSRSLAPIVQGIVSMCGVPWGDGRVASDLDELVKLLCRLAGPVFPHSPCSTAPLSSLLGPLWAYGPHARPRALAGHERAAPGSGDLYNLPLPSVRGIDLLSSLFISLTSCHHHSRCHGLFPLQIHPLPSQHGDSLLRQEEPGQE